MDARDTNPNTTKTRKVGPGRYEVEVNGETVGWVEKVTGGWSSYLYNEDGSTYLGETSQRKRAVWIVESEVE